VHALSADIELVMLFGFSVRISVDEDVWSVDESFLEFLTLGKSPNRSIFVHRSDGCSLPDIYGTIPGMFFPYTMPVGFGGKMIDVKKQRIIISSLLNVYPLNHKNKP
jgi:hypothetical protein